MFELVENKPNSAVIKVIGIGGAGGNAVQHMVTNRVQGVDFIAMNTDAQALQRVDARVQLQIGSSLTRGLGAGADPEIGRQAAIDDRERIETVLEGADLVFITCGMGGGTGTGAAPIVAEIARSKKILTVAVVTKPFGFERRSPAAERGIDQLVQHVDSLITIPNEKLRTVLGEKTPLMAAFAAANNVLLGAVQGIADLIIRPGIINVDFADVRTVMREAGRAMMGTGSATGEHRAREAAEAAIRSPLLDDIDLTGARGLLVNITAGPDLGIGEFEEIGDMVRALTAETATVVVGTAIDPELTDELRVTVVATGIGRAEAAVEAAPPLLVPRPVVGTQPNYEELEAPAWGRARSLRQQQAAPEVPREDPRDARQGVRVQPRVAARGRAEASSPAGDLDFLDIPAFLRKQAD